MDASLIAYTTVTAILAATPGATTAVVIRHTLSGGRRGGYAAAFGAAAGNVTQALVVGLGAGLLLQRSTAVFSTIQIAGGLYLVWLGLQALRDLWQPLDRTAPGSGVESHAAFRHALVTNLLNPSIVTFYLVVVPGFVGDGGTARVLVLGAIHVTLAFAFHCAWATLLDMLRTWFASPLVTRSLAVATAAALVWLGIRTLTAA